MTALTIIAAVAVVLTSCMPFFILKIRNQVVEINNKLTRIVAVLEAQLSEKSIPIARDEDIRETTICPKCGRETPANGRNCIHCYGTLLTSDTETN